MEIQQNYSARNGKRNFSGKRKIIQVRNSGLKLPDTRFLSFSCSKVFSRLFRFTILERFLVIVFCSLSLFYPLTFWLRISPVLFSFPLSLKLLFAFHPLSHCARHLAPCGKTDFSTFCPNMVHMTLASNSYFWVCLVLVKKQGGVQKNQGEPCLFGGRVSNWVMSIQGCD